ncbi:MAG: DNA-binding response regulator [Bacteroidetes bacterium]|nr:MAG: DNA-binding response regulator [Bacteroidota bacterium]
MPQPCKVLIIDDEADARQLIRQYLEELPHMQIAAECRNGIEAVQAIDQHEPDLVFMDIQMPGLSGFQVLQQIVHIPQIIFSTAFDKYALKAFDHHAVDYLLKPYTRERFSQAIQKVMLAGNRHRDQIRQLDEQLQKETGSYPERLLVEQGNKLVSIKTNEVVWLEADGDYTRIHNSRQFFLSGLGIGQLEQKLNPAIFLRIHRGAIINIHQIQEVHREASGPQVVMQNGTVHKVSRTYTEALKKLII